MRTALLFFSLLMLAAGPGAAQDKPQNPLAGKLFRRYASCYQLTVEKTNEPLPLYAAQQVRWLLPTRLRWVSNHQISRRKVRFLRYRHNGLFALFDARGHRLTPFLFKSVLVLAPHVLMYTTPTSDYGTVEVLEVLRQAGVPQPAAVNSGGRWGLLDSAGRILTEPVYLGLQLIGHNALWAMKSEHGQVYYGLLDTLGRASLPFGLAPVSAPDAAGLLRRRSTPPLPVGSFGRTDGAPAVYPDTSTVGFYRLDGQPAFPGRFTAASGFWHDTAVVSVGERIGLIDPQGHWLATVNATELATTLWSDERRQAEWEADRQALFAPPVRSQRWAWFK
jgi:hypothetical protein